MSLFQHILTSLTANLSSQEVMMKEISLHISHELGISLESFTCTLKKGVLYITTTPTIKMAINMRKGELLTFFQEKKFPINTIS